jgi:hypothetical protein
LAESGLDYKTLRVSDLFSQYNYYQVPKYQRDYAWTDEEIDELMEDLLEAWRDYGKDAYLLGQIIVCPAQDVLASIDTTIEQWDLIDGQQRCTTLLLLLIVASSLIKKSEEESKSVADDRKDATRLGLVTISDEKDSELLHPRIRTASDGGEFISKLLNEQPLTEFRSATQENMANAVERITFRLSTIKNSADLNRTQQIRNFLEFVQSKVYVVRLALESNTHALRIFQKVNNRGLQLDDADLIKSFLFESVTYSDYHLLSDYWTTASNTLQNARLKRLKSMEFLLKALVGIRTGKSISTSKIYETWSELLKGSDEVKTFAEKLPQSATYVDRIGKGLLPSTGSPTDISDGMHRFKSIQQIEVLLAGSNLSKQSYEILLQTVEDRTMLSMFADEPPQAFERIIHPWAKKVSELDSNASLGEIIQATACTFEEYDFDRLARNGFDGIQRLNYLVKSHRDKIRYALARANKVFQLDCKMNYSMGTLMQTKDKRSRNEGLGYDIDHIFPQSESARSAWIHNSELNEEHHESTCYTRKVHSIGNLTLLNPSDNGIQLDAFPWEDEKVANYSGSDLRLNLTLVNPENWQTLQPDVKAQLNNLVSHYSQTTASWGEKEIDARAELYWSLILKDFRRNLTSPH